MRPPPEAELVEAGKLTMGQLAQAHRDRLETGNQVLDIIVERGWVPAQDDGDLITAGETDGAEKAAALGHAFVADLTQENGEWPFFGGRFINPETIVSVDLLSG